MVVVVLALEVDVRKNMRVMRISSEVCEYLSEAMTAELVNHGTM
jgi:hypothetical protein